MKTSEEPIVVEQAFSVSAHRLWEAITERDQMVQWFFEAIPAFEARVGFETRFDVLSGGRIFPHLWRIAEVEPGRRIAYDWSYPGYPGDALVVFEISVAGDGSVLKVTHTMREDSPEEFPEFRRESGLAGWTFFIQERLPLYLQEGS